MKVAQNMYFSGPANSFQFFHEQTGVRCCTGRQAQPRIREDEKGDQLGGTRADADLGEGIKKDMSHLPHTSPYILSFLIEYVVSSL